MISTRFNVQQLLDPAAYPWPVDEVRLIETHISWVLLAGDRVVKLKRPVDLGFVDFRDPATRKQACEDEVRLNKRLTEGIYLGVVPVTAKGVDAPGEVLEWATLMRRLPADRMLDVLLQQDAAPADLAELLAGRLIPFHTAPQLSFRAQPRDILAAASLPENSVPGLRDSGRGNSLWLPLSPERTSPLPAPARIGPDMHNGDIAIGNEGAHGEAPLPAPCPPDPDVYLKVLTDNLAQVVEAAGDILGHGQLDLVDRSMRAYMDNDRDLLRWRFQHWLREGHGDLRCEHICLEGDLVQIFDCVEFEITIRCADVASDLAFLLMDFRRLGADAIGNELLDRYRASGFDLPRPVVDLYGTHRALVRAKVAALERSGHDQDEDRRHAFEAASYLDIATSFACPSPPMLVLVSGLSGSGKSTVATVLAQATNGTMFASDLVRKEMAGLDPAESAAADWHQGIYTDDWTARTYDRLLELAAAELDLGGTAIVDATFLDNDERERFVELSRARRLPAVIVWTVLDDDVARERIEHRAQERGSASDATLAIRERQIDSVREHPVHVPDGTLAVTIDTGASGPPSRDPFFAALETAGLLGTLAGRPLS